MTGTSVLAIKYADGVMMSADTLGEFQKKRVPIFFFARASSRKGSYERSQKDKSPYFAYLHIQFPPPPFLLLSLFPSGSYGSLARYTELRRIRRVGDYTLIAAGGEYSDFQSIMDMLNELVLDEHVRDDNAKLSASEIHSYLTRVMYQRRNKFDPFYNSLVVAGFKDGKP